MRIAECGFIKIEFSALSFKRERKKRKGGSV
jgi:hypothetical protein